MIRRLLVVLVVLVVVCIKTVSMLQMVAIILLPNASPPATILLHHCDRGEIAL